MDWSFMFMKTINLCQICGRVRDWGRESNREKKNKCTDKTTNRTNNRNPAGIEPSS